MFDRFSFKFGFKQLRTIQFRSSSSCHQSKQTHSRLIEPAQVHCTSDPRLQRYKLLIRPDFTIPPTLYPWSLKQTIFSTSNPGPMAWMSADSPSALFNHPVQAPTENPRGQSCSTQSKPLPLLPVIFPSSRMLLSGVTPSPKLNQTRGCASMFKVIGFNMMKSPRTNELLLAVAAKTARRRDESCMVSIELVMLSTLLMILG